MTPCLADHAKLVQAGGAYAELYSAQFSAAVAEVEQDAVDQSGVGQDEADLAGSRS